MLFKLESANLYLFRLNTNKKHDYFNKILIMFYGIKKQVDTLELIYFYLKIPK